MHCDAFRTWIDHTTAAISSVPMPPAVRRHHDTCSACRAWLREERAWQHAFARVPDVIATPAVWPGVRAAIQVRHVPNPSLSTELVALGRFLVPALAMLVLCLGGLALWQDLEAPDTRMTTSVLVTDPTTELAFLHQEPDAILQQWVGISEP